MIRRLAILLLLAGCVGAQESTIPESPGDLVYPPLKFEVPDPAGMRSELAGGTVLYLAEDNSLPIVDIHIFVRGGSYWEPEGKMGLAGMTGTMMRTGGTESRSPQEIDEEIDFLAANLGVSIGDAQGSASLSILSKDLDKGLALLFDVLRNPGFDPAALDTLKAQILDNLKARNDSTAAIEGREADMLFYGADHPVNRLPTKASVESITREDLILFHRECFYPANFVIAAAGAFRKEELVRKLEKHFEGWENRKPRKIAAPPAPPAPKPGIYCFHKEGENINQGRVTIGHMGIDVRNPDLHKIRLMAYIYGTGGFSSRLMQKVRSEEGLAYDVGFRFRPGLLHPQPFTIEFQSKSESCAYAAKLCLEELRKIQEDLVSEEELAAAKQFFLDGFPGFFFDTKFDTAVTYARAEYYAYPDRYFQTYREMIAAVTREDLRRVAREYLRPDRFAWVVVGDIPAVKKGDEKKGVKLSDLGTVIDVPLPDPLTLKRPD